jgi:hypothetical protein
MSVVDLATTKALFTERGADGYWSPDGTRVIYESFVTGQANVSIWDLRTRRVTRAVVPASVGDYYSWGLKHGRDLILTITSHYFSLDENGLAGPISLVPPCDGYGSGERPLISHDGRRITTFVRGDIVIRNLEDCQDIIDTAAEGAKADFSWDGRYIAFHALKQTGTGYDIFVIDLIERTIRTVTAFRGSSFFPSWTRDGQLCFRYDGPEYRGFMLGRHILDAKARPLGTPRLLPASRRWKDIFPETPRPKPALALVMVWGTWSAHSPMALVQLGRARDRFKEERIDIAVLHATDPGSREGDVRETIDRARVSIGRIPIAPHRLWLTEAHNQIPTLLLFRNGRLIDRRLGARDASELHEWVWSVARSGR